MTKKSGDAEKSIHRMASLTREAKIIAEAADRSVDPSRRSASERIRALQAQRDAVISKMVPVASARVVVRRACTAKGNGELAELAFIPKAASLGFGVARPFGDSERYDYILDSGERLWQGAGEGDVQQVRQWIPDKHGQSSESQDAHLHCC